MIYDLAQKNISWKNIYISPERLHYYDELILFFNTIMPGATLQKWKEGKISQMTKEWTKRAEK